MGFETILFLALGLLAIFSATMMVRLKNAVHSALFLIINFGCVALLYLMLDAPFLSMVQIAVYAGAIMVLFLFVIMLLGAEQSTDAGSGTTNWMIGAAAVLGILFIGVPLGMAFYGLNLPESPGADPLVRVVHAANVSDPVSIAISGENIEEEIVVEDVSFGDVTNFLTVPAGAYTVIITDAAGKTFGSETLPALVNNEIVTVVAYGDADTGTLSMMSAATDLSPTAPDSARIQVLNLLAEPVMLVDLGRNDRLDTTQRDTGETVPSDRVLVSDLATATLSESVDYPQGTATLAFYSVQDGEFVSQSRLNDWTISDGTEQFIVITPDYGATTDTLGNYRPRVLDREQQKLTIDSFSSFGSPSDIGNLLFTKYLLPVNMVGFLLLVALIGVIVLTRPEGLTGERRATVNRRRKVSRPLVSVISQQTGRDVIVDVPRLQEPDSDE